MRHSQKLDPQKAEAMMDRMIGDPEPTTSDRDTVREWVTVLRRHTTQHRLVVIEPKAAGRLADVLERALEGGR